LRRIDHIRSLMIELHAKAIEARALPAITVQDVATVLRPVWTGPNHSQGGRLRSLIERTFRANLIEPNPAEWDRLKELRDPQGKPVLASKTVEAESFANMPYDELPALMGELAADQSEPGRALRFLILTAARSAEVIGADWNEIDMAARTWTIPAEKMKAGRKHIVPLSDAALACLGPQGNGAVFPVTNTRNGRLNANALYKHLLGYRSGITAHGMRSTFATWAQNAGHPIPVIDVALAHKEKNRTRRAYLRSEYLPERRKLMADWASFARPA
jgi:integrase